jgi:hypothetical protein
VEEGSAGVAGSRPSSPWAEPGTSHQAFAGKLEKLHFYREEIKHEYNLLSGRVSAYITSQAFLVTGYGLSMGNANPQWGSIFRLVFPTTLAVLGITLSLLVWPSIKGACDTIELWHAKQEALFDHDPSMAEYRIERRVLRRGHKEPMDLIHERSFLFARSAPWVFAPAWLVFGLLAVILFFAR